MILLNFDFAFNRKIDMNIVIGYKTKGVSRFLRALRIGINTLGHCVISESDKTNSELDANFILSSSRLYFEEFREDNLRLHSRFTFYLRGKWVLVDARL